MASRKSVTNNLDESVCNFTANLEEDDDQEGYMEIGGIVIPPPALTFDPTGPRLFIQRIVIENFKSYGGKTILGPYHKNFAAVVGPNGSGKSNVIDALLFVFGYRAQKIRSKTVGVLIHKSDAFPNCNSCTVSVHFEKIIDKGIDEFEVLPNSEFSVSRVAFRDNSSHYMVNERRVIFKEVSCLLRSHGIDLDHNRFLILQGEVEQISLMKPISTNPHETGMLEFLEDIIGTGRLKEPIDKLQTSVDELNERRSEKLKRVKTAQADKDELEGQKNEALQFITLKNEAAVKKHTITQTIIYQRRKKLDTGTQDLQSIEETNSAFLDSYKKADKEILIVRESSLQLSQKQEEVTKTFEENQAKFNQLELEDVSNREDLKHARDKIKRFNQNIKKEMGKVEELSRAPEKLEKEIEELQAVIEQTKDKKTKAETNLAEVTSTLKVESSQIQDEKEQQETRLFEKQTIANDLKSKVDLATSELDLYTKEEDDEKNKLTGMNINFQTIDANIETRKNDTHDFKEKIPKLKKERERIAKQLNELCESEPVVTEKFNSLRVKLEEARNNMQNHASRNRLLDALLKEKAEGRISGILGRLGDLGGIDKKYDVAVSTACPQLDNIVTDTLETAMSCVKFLKQNNLGLATFIALDKMNVWKQNVNKAIKTPRDVPRLFDLIKVKDKSLLPAFYFVMRDTLVAENIEEATVIGLQGQTRYRVVTLKGELVELSGTMSGGGSRPIRGRMGTAAAASELTEAELLTMERNVSDLQRQREEIVMTKRKFEETMGHLDVELETKQHSLERFAMEVEQLEKQKIGLRTQIKEQEIKYNSAKADPAKVVELTTVLETHQRDFAEAEKKVLKLKAKVLALHERIVEIGGNKLKAAQKLVNDVNRQIDQLGEEINKKTFAITTSKKNHGKAKENITKIETEIKEMEESTIKLKEKIREAEINGMALSDEKDTIEKEKAEVDSEVQQIRTSLKKLLSAKAEMERKKLDINTELDRARKVVTRLTEEIEVWKEKLSKIKQIEIAGIEVQPFPTLTDEELSNLDKEHMENILAKMDDQLTKTSPNLGVIERYKEKEELYLQRVEEFDVVTKDRDDMRKCYDELKKRRFDEFMSGFTIISRKLKETYQMLTLGGDADLELVNSLDPFSDGILFSVRPPRKSWKSITNLSGGEKTLSSLSLIFSLHYYKPTPFYIMDEIDAALDFRNVAIVAHYIKEQTKNAQFIVVSLRENMFEQANRLVGVYKTYDISHSVSLDINRFEKV